jgi:hypothetical protein
VSGARDARVAAETAFSGKLAAHTAAVSRRLQRAFCPPQLSSLHKNVVDWQGMNIYVRLASSQLRRLRIWADSAIGPVKARSGSAHPNPLSRHFCLKNKITNIRVPEHLTGRKPPQRSQVVLLQTPAFAEP